MSAAGSRPDAELAGGRWFFPGIGVFLMAAAAATLFASSSGSALDCGEPFGSCSGSGFLIALLFFMGFLVALFSMAARKGEDEVEPASTRGAK